MSPKERKRLEKAGYTVGSAAQFLGLTLEEEAKVEKRLRKKIRQSKKKPFRKKA